MAQSNTFSNLIQKPIRSDLHPERRKNYAELPMQIPQAVLSHQRLRISPERT